MMGLAASSVLLYSVGELMEFGKKNPLLVFDSVGSELFVLLVCAPKIPPFTFLRGALQRPLSDFTVTISKPPPPLVPGPLFAHIAFPHTKRKSLLSRIRL